MSKIFKVILEKEWLDKIVEEGISDINPIVAEFFEIVSLLPFEESGGKELTINYNLDENEELFDAIREFIYENNYSEIELILEDM